MRPHFDDIIACIQEQKCRPRLHRHVCQTLGRTLRFVCAIHIARACVCVCVCVLTRKMCVRNCIDLCVLSEGQIERRFLVFAVVVVWVGVYLIDERVHASLRKRTPEPVLLFLYIHTHLVFFFERRLFWLRIQLHFRRKVCKSVSVRTRRQLSSLFFSPKEPLVDELFGFSTVRHFVHNSSFVCAADESEVVLGVVCFLLFNVAQEIASSRQQSRLSSQTRTHVRVCLLCKSSTHCVHVCVLHLLTFSVINYSATWVGKKKEEEYSKSLGKYFMARRWTAKNKIFEQRNWFDWRLTEHFECSQTHSSLCLCVCGIFLQIRHKNAFNSIEKRIQSLGFQSPELCTRVSKMDRIRLRMISDQVTPSQVYLPLIAIRRWKAVKIDQTWTRLLYPKKRTQYCGPVCTHVQKTCLSWLGINLRICFFDRFSNLRNVFWNQNGQKSQETHSVLHQAPTMHCRTVRLCIKNHWPHTPAVLGRTTLFAVINVFSQTNCLDLFGQGHKCWL